MVAYMQPKARSCWREYFNEEKSQSERGEKVKGREREHGFKGFVDSQNSTIEFLVLEATGNLIDLIDR